jgi:hypothetical protein
MIDDLCLGAVEVFGPPSSDLNYSHLLNHALRHCMISHLNLLQIFTPLQEAFDELADSLARSSCGRCSRMFLSIALVLARSLSRFDQSRSEMRTDNFVVLFIVPV